MEEEKQIAMYDVRGIQNYIFRTTKVKDAMGASQSVEDLLSDAMREAVRVYNQKKIEAGQKEEILPEECLEWKKDGRAKAFDEHWEKMQVLFIGGGNAYVLYESKALYQEINRTMSVYILSRTYSLQLAAACVQMGDNYSKDYRALNDEMVRVKADQILSKPFGALPVMKTELDTGYPLDVPEKRGEAVLASGSMETQLKQKKKRERKENEDEKIFDNLVQEKGVDSTLAVVHLDGNNMGLRIRAYIEGVEDYKTAVERMREISIQISESYRQTFDDMKKMFDDKAYRLKQFQGREKRAFIRKIVVAGDDITYVCNGWIALATVEYFVRKIEARSMLAKGMENGGEGSDKEAFYRFSVCAGIAYMGSHFPFYAAYETAEACCDMAKKRAKEEENLARLSVDDREETQVGSFVDFQICKNIFSRNLKRIRQKEYVTWKGEHLLRRPYFVETKDNKERFSNAGRKYSFQGMRDAVRYFQQEVSEEGAGTKAGIPRRFAKEIRNEYPNGRHQTEALSAFLQSRGWKLPDGTTDLFDSTTAKWYDALEMMDLYVDLDHDILEAENTEAGEAETKAVCAAE